MERRAATAADCRLGWMKLAPLPAGLTRSHAPRRHFQLGEQENSTRFYQETIAALGNPDILVNNVGGRRGSVNFEETSMEQFQEGLEVNLICAVRLSSLVLAHMKGQKWGRIINISSIWGREHGGSIDYMTGKAGLIAFSKHLALQMAPHNVLVNCVAPVHLISLTRKLSYCGLQLLLVSGADGDLAAFPSQGAGNLPAQSPTATGNHGHAPI